MCVLKTSLLTFLLKASLLHDLSFLSPSFQLFPHLFACGGLLTQVNMHLPFHPLHDLKLHMQYIILVIGMHFWKGMLHVVAELLHVVAVLLHLDSKEDSLI